MSGLLARESAGLVSLVVALTLLTAKAQGGVWLLSPGLCDALMAMDVMLCTASIFNLCAISVDRWAAHLPAPCPSPPGPAPRPGPPPHSTTRRFVAVAVPLSYNSQSWGGRQLLLIGATWLLSAAVAAPVLCGLNDARGRDPAVCRLENRDYVVYSSLCSFFLPCPLMLLLYWATFRGLRRWEAARLTKLHGRAPRGPSGPGPPPAEALAPPEAIRAEHARRRRGVQITGQERKAMRVLPVVVGGYLPRSAKGRVAAPRAPGRVEVLAHAPPPPPPPGAFLICWTPFFVVHVTRALCPACAVPPRLVSAVTWLGYVNSAINPVIYTVFNVGFRTVFRKALRKALRLCC